MSKFLHVPTGEYKIVVQQGNQITLDTNPNRSDINNQQGKVVITGDLEVWGNQTTVESEIMVVKDNIIVINDGENGAGVTLDIAGLRIDRGTESDAYMIFDENLSWVDPVTATTKAGAFTFRNESGALVGLRANSISTGGGNLYLINSGTGVISVTGTTDYENQVTDDDDITNKKYVDDAITTAFATVFLTQIGDGVVDPSTVKVLDNETTGNASLIRVSVDNTTVAEFYEDRLELTDIRITGTMIETTSSDQDLILSAPGTGSIRINDILHLNSVPGIDDVTLVPSFPTNGTKLYITSQSTGGTGIYFANSEQTRDELISNNRSLVYSMIF